MLVVVVRGGHNQDVVILAGVDLGVVRDLQGGAGGLAVDERSQAPVPTSCRFNCKQGAPPPL